MAYDFDAIVIGSGITGGWAAKELTEKGFKTLLVDRGRHIQHREDYITENKADFNLLIEESGHLKKNKKKDLIMIRL